MTQALKPVEVPGDGGETVFLVGDTYTTLLSGAQTGGAFTLLEALVPPDTGPPPHIHHAEDETFILVDGSLTFTLGDKQIEAKSGAVIFVPKGTRHSFKNVGGGIARMLFIYNPPGMEGMFAELGKPGKRGVKAPPLDPKDVEAMIAIARKYKFSIAP
jgi:mannose-6-phosphate isomerase-like protein (cupin superfamily)